MSLAVVEENYDLDALANQLKMVVESGDPLTYMERNINYEIDKDVESVGGEKLKFNSAHMASAAEARDRLRAFKDWLERSRIAKKVKNALCTIVDRIKEVIDAEGTLKQVLTTALAALPIALMTHPVAVTVLVGFLATMILDGVTNFCAA